MRVLNWNNPHYFSLSLGAIASAALATEYINTHIEPVKVKVPEWYREVWPIFLPSERINPKRLLSEDYCPLMNEYIRAYGHFRIGWLESLVRYANYHTHVMVPFTPVNSLPCNKESHRVLIYPREHHNKNKTYTPVYWIEICNKLTALGFQIIAILHESKSHRDRSRSIEWCKELRNNIRFEHVYKSTIPNLYRAIQECSHSIGTMTGPSWLCLKSDIKQIVLSSHSDEPRLSNRPELNLPYFTKPVTISVGTNTDWINEL